MNAFQEIAILGTKSGNPRPFNDRDENVAFSFHLSQNEVQYFRINMLYFDTLSWYNICRK